jgi:large-conductance mechanosensitive channel
MIFGETIKQYLNYVIIAATVVLIVFFVIMYKKRNSILKTDKVLPVKNESDKKEYSKEELINANN